MFLQKHKRQLHIINQDDLKGLPEGTIEAAKNLAESTQKEGMDIYFRLSKLYPFYDLR